MNFPIAARCNVNKEIRPSIKRERWTLEQNKVKILIKYYRIAVPIRKVKIIDWNINRLICDLDAKEYEK